MSHIILLALSFFCISNIRAAQESKAMAEDRSEIAIPAADVSTSTAPRTSPSHAPVSKPWQTFAHGILSPKLCRLIFGYALEARNRWTITIDEYHRPIFLSKDKRNLYVYNNGLLKHDIDTGALQSQSPIDEIEPAIRCYNYRDLELFPMEGDRVIVATGSCDDVRSIDTRAVPKERREHHVLPKKFWSHCAFNGYLVTPNDQGKLDIRNAKTLEPQADKFFQCNPGPKVRDFQFLYSVGDRFLFAIYANGWKEDWENLTMEVFDNKASHRSIHSLPWPLARFKRPEAIEQISAHRFAVMACYSDEVRILNTKTQKLVAISTPDEIISALAKFGKNKLLTGGNRGTIALWRLTNPPRKKEMVNNQGNKIMSLVRLNNNEFLSLDIKQGVKLWNAKEGVCMLQLQDQKYRGVDDFISLRDGYIIHNENIIHRLQITSELQSAYEAESESHADESRKAKLKRLAHAKKTASTSRPSSPESSPTSKRSRSLSPARPAAAAAGTAPAINNHHVIS